MLNFICKIDELLTYDDTKWYTFRERVIEEIRAEHSGILEIRSNVKFAATIDKIVYDYYKPGDNTPIKSFYSQCKI